VKPAPTSRLVPAAVLVLAAACSKADSSLKQPKGINRLAYPVLMAAVPSALGLGPGAETRGPMADAVIGGLVLSTALSLLVVPAFYVVAARMRSTRESAARLVCKLEQSEGAD
jgi:predicted permease